MEPVRLYQNRRGKGKIRESVAKRIAFRPFFCRKLNEMDKTKLYTLKLPGDIHEENVEEINEMFEDALADEHYHIALDCTKLEYLYSVGIRVLLKYQKFSKLKGGAIYLFNIRDRVSNVLSEINLLDFLNGYATWEEMVEALEA